MRAWLARLAAIPASEWRDFALAHAALLHAQVTVWRRPAGALVRPAKTPTDAASSEVASPEVEALADAVRRAARYSPLRPQCLVRAIALARLLRARGYAGARVRVGVRRQGERMVAHAWVEYGGAVVGEPERVADAFVAMGDAEVQL